MPLFIGINGFGRIGKTLFLQLIDDPAIQVAAINAPGFNIQNIATYLRYDSIHKYPNHFSIKIINETTFSVNDRMVSIFNDRDASNLKWRDHGIKYVIDATGSYLTTEKAGQHQVDYVMMTSPPKDNTPIFVYGVNQQFYNGQRVVSNASCTTNCIAPVLHFLETEYGIVSANFTTIHATTASQKTIDVLSSSSRTTRSILNNIIPHSTGASSSLAQLIPRVGGQIKGTSLRVPVSNVSIVDLNVRLNKDGAKLQGKSLLEDILEKCEDHWFIQLSKDGLVSSDFITSECPSIIDTKASMMLGEDEVKLMIWYDNEWSYSRQCINLLEIMALSNGDIDEIE